MGCGSRVWYLETQGLRLEVVGEGPRARFVLEDKSFCVDEPETLRAIAAACELAATLIEKLRP